MALLLAGCADFSLDLDRAGRKLRGHPPPPAPVLSETPPADLAAPGGMRATRGELREIALRWEPVLEGDVAGYVVERALAEQGPFTRVAVLGDRFETGVLDRGFDLAPKSAAAGGEPGLGDGAEYFYRVRAFDGSGHIAGAASGVAAGRTAPPPDPPKGLRVVSRLPRKVALVWRASGDATVKGYEISRSPGADGPFEPIAALDGRHLTHYVDRGLGDLGVFFYRVRSVNQAGAAGEPSEPVQGLTKPDPLPPVGLHISQREGNSLVLAWQPNVEPDVVAYRVLRLREGEKEAEEVGTVAAPETTLRDDDSPPGEIVSYQVIAIDADGLESEPAELSDTDASGKPHDASEPSTPAPSG